jgi:penicillin-binding protein 2
VENAGWGAGVAAPIARRVFDYVLLGQYPSEEDMLAVQAGKAAAPIGKPRLASEMNALLAAGITSGGPAKPKVEAAAASPKTKVAKSARDVKAAKTAKAAAAAEAARKLVPAASPLDISPD